MENLSQDFTNVTTRDEEYFAYSLYQDPRWTPEDRKIISGWRLDYREDISNSTDNGSDCYGNSLVDYKGCDLWRQPTCRNNLETFVLRSGRFMQKSGLAASAVDVKNSSLSFSDRRENCWNNSDCFGFYGFESGCIYWTGKDLQFEQSRSVVQRYVVNPISSDKDNLKQIPAN